MSKSFNVKMSSKTQQGAYENSAIHTCRGTTFDGCIKSIQVVVFSKAII